MFNSSFFSFLLTNTSSPYKRNIKKTPCKNKIIKNTPTASKNRKPTKRVMPSCIPQNSPCEITHQCYFCYFAPLTHQTDCFKAASKQTKVDSREPTASPSNRHIHYKAIHLSPRCFKLLFVTQIRFFLTDVFKVKQCIRT